MGEIPGSCGSGIVSHLVEQGLQAFSSHLVGGQPEQRFDLCALDLLTYFLFQPCCPEPLPEWLVLAFGILLLVPARPFQVAKRHHAEVHPTLHSGEVTQLVLAHAQFAFHLLEKLLNLSAILPSKIEMGRPGSP